MIEGGMSWKSLENRAGTGHFRAKMRILRPFPVNPFDSDGAGSEFVPDGGSLAIAFPD